jgi:hypothetical protein
LTLVVAFIVIVGVWALVLASGIAGGSVEWWRLPAACVTYLGLQFTIAAGCRRFSLSKKAYHFLSTLPIATTFLVVAVHGANRLPPGGLTSAFVIVEAVTLVLAAISWHLRRPEPGLR